MRPWSRAFFCRQTWSVSFILLVTPLRRLHVVKDQRLLVQCIRLPSAFELPSRHVRIISIVPQSFAVGRLIFLAKMSATGFVAVQRVHAHQFAKFEEIS